LALKSATAEPGEISTDPENTLGLCGDF